MWQILGLMGLAVWAFSSKERKRPAPVQLQFERFHNAIKLDADDEQRKLREKREVLLRSLADGLPQDFPKFAHFVQGSYAMRTGVVPLDGNYDIDVGLIFECTEREFPDPVALKRRVRDALAGYGRTVDIRRSCVTVTYIRNGRPDYHVDLALYVRGKSGSLLLAKGREFSGADQCKWVQAFPKELTAYILGRFSGGEQAQFRRCVRYLKRWRDHRFNSDGPISIALTVAAAHWFQPKHGPDGKPSDLEALHALVKKMLEKSGAALGVAGRVIIKIPGPGGCDLMAGMTNRKMAGFRERLSELDRALAQCYGQVDVSAACLELQGQFGVGFTNTVSQNKGVPARKGKLKRI
ncbi:cyclic GMP-AMP synthase DncV-like nucleotidyltransferase [Pseudoduganella namucuonensis]|nr:nucleotidyltransferase [Pseudoduganella namucuonensis]